MCNNSPIGVFDSGLGGLSVCHALRTLLPKEMLTYFADLGFSPYGTKSTQAISDRSEYIVRFLIDQGCKLIVVACNTATVNAISTLRSTFNVPIVGIEPAIKPAALQSKNGRIGVLATEQTLRSDAFKQLMARYSGHAEIERKACPHFVHLVESLDHEGDKALKAAQHYIQPMLEIGCDQIVLGCTHFSFLKPLISQVVRDKANIIDTAKPVALEVKRKLHQLSLKTDQVSDGRMSLWTSGCPIKTSGAVRALWGSEVEVLPAIDTSRIK